MDKPALWRTVRERLDAALPGWMASPSFAPVESAVERREAGGAWSDNEVFEAVALSVLSANVDWSKVEGVLPELDDLFDGFDLRAYAELPQAKIANTLVPWFQARKAGSMTLARNLDHLVQAAGVLCRRGEEHGSVDSYLSFVLRSADHDPKRAAVLLGHRGPHKVPGLGVPLAAEALKNLGYDVAKPDRHLTRAVGCFGLVEFGTWSAQPERRAGSKPPTQTVGHQRASMTAVEDLAKSAGQHVVLVDWAIWSLCARSRLGLDNRALEQLADEARGAERSKGLAALIERWMADDPVEQRETYAHITHALDENRLSDRKLFPEELKGKSW